MTSRSFAKYKFNVIARLNQLIKYLRESREELDQRRLIDKKNIRARSSHTNWQRIELTRLVLKFYDGRYPNDDGIKSRHFYRKQKKTVASEYTTKVI